MVPIQWHADSFGQGSFLTFSSDFSSRSSHYSSLLRSGPCVCCYDTILALTSQKNVMYFQLTAIDLQYTVAQVAITESLYRSLGPRNSVGCPGKLQARPSGPSQNFNWKLAPNVSQESQKMSEAINLRLKHPVGPVTSAIIGPLARRTNDPNAWGSWAPSKMPRKHLKKTEII